MLYTFCVFLITLKNTKKAFLGGKAFFVNQSVMRFIVFLSLNFLFKVFRYFAFLQNSKLNQ